MRIPDFLSELLFDDGEGHNLLVGLPMGSIDRENRGAVLVVDDDEDLRSEMRDVLQAEGYFVLEARDGSYAVETLGSAAGSAVRLVILDLLMPFMTGWELVDYLCKDPRFSHIAILVMSALPVHGDASGVGATRYWIRKPFGVAELVAAVNVALGHAEADRDGPEPPLIGGASRPSRSGH